MTYQLLLQLLESEGGDDFEKIVSLIKRDCQPFLNNSHGLLYRGISSDEIHSSNMRELQDGCYVGTVRQDRKPSATSDLDHDGFNLYFTKHMGIPLRSQCLFVTGPGGDGDGTFYGKPHLIFPIGEYNFAWSPVVSDLYSYFAGIVTLLYNADLYLLKDNHLNLEHRSILTRFAHWFKDNISKYSTKTFDELTRSFQKKRSNVIEILGEDKLKQILSDFVDFLDIYKFNEDFDEAIESRHEIMLTCHQYYAINLVYADVHSLKAKLNR